MLAASFAVAGCGAGDDGDDGGDPAAASTTTVGPPVTRVVTTEEVAVALLTLEASPMTLDPSAGLAGAHCLAERLPIAGSRIVDAGSFAEFEDELIADDETLMAFADALFGCLDLRSFVLADLEVFDEDQGACAADRIVADPEIRLLYLVGSETGSPVPDQTPEIAAAFERERAIVLECASAITGGDLPRFCAATEVVSDGVQPPDVLGAAYDEVLAAVPDAVRADAESVVPLLREIAVRFSAVEDGADPEEIAASLTPEQRTVIDDLAEAQRTGDAGDSPIGRLVGLATTSCSELQG